MFELCPGSVVVLDWYLIVSIPNFCFLTFNKLKKQTTKNLGPGSEEKLRKETFFINKCPGAFL